MLLACGWLTLAAAATSPQAEAAFARGVAAFEAGDYAAAVEAFEQARATGLDSGALHFNLGVAYYRLGDLEQARAAFRRATRTPEMAAPAYYNLGRIAREAGRTGQAADWFARAADAARTEAVRARAREARAAALDEAPAPAGPAGVDGAVTLGLGHDDNVTLLPDDPTFGTAERDAFVYGAVELERRAGTDGRLFADVYAERFDDSSEFAYTRIEAGYARRLDAAGWGREARVSGQLARFGGATYEYGLHLEGAAWRGRGDGGWLDLEADLRLLRGGDDFEYLDGTTLDARATIGGATPADSEWQAGARLGYEDRADFSQGGDFFSFSRTEAAVYGRFEWALTPRVAAALDLELGLRDYAGTERRDGTALGGRRDSLLGVIAALERDLTPRWQLTTDLALTRRDSNIEEFDFDREVARLGLRYGF